VNIVPGDGSSVGGAYRPRESASVVDVPRYAEVSTARSDEGPGPLGPERQPRLEKHPLLFLLPTCE